MTNMDIKKLNVPTLDGPNWGSYAVHVQVAAWILDCWDVIKGETMGMNPQTYDLLPFLTPGTTGIHPVAAEYTAARTTWNKKKTQALGLIQGTMSLVLWPDFVTFGKCNVNRVGNEIQKSGESIDLPPIGQYSEN